MVMFLVKRWCVFLDVLQSSEKTEFLNNGKNVLMEPLKKASEGSVFNLAIDEKEIPGNKAASLSDKLVKKEMGNRGLFEVFGGNLPYWPLPFVDSSIENAMVRQSQCKNYLAVGKSPENRTEWQRF